VFGNKKIPLFQFQPTFFTKSHCAARAKDTNDFGFGCSSAGISPAGFGPGEERKTAGETPALVNAHHNRKRGVAFVETNRGETCGLKKTERFFVSRSNGNVDGIGMQKRNLRNRSVASRKKIFAASHYRRRL